MIIRHVLLALHLRISFFLSFEVNVNDLGFNFGIHMLTITL